MEKRRLEDCRMLEQGYSQADVARKLEVSGAAACKWKKRRQLERLQGSLCRGAQKARYADELWTLGRMARLIEDHFGVSYHPGHVWGMTRSMGWSCPKPIAQ
jgi:transposase